MAARTSILILCGSIAVVGCACATKSFVQERVTATETKLDQRAEIHETKLRETADLARTARQAIDGADQQLKSVDMQLKRLDARVGEAGTAANTATARADSVAAAAQDAEARLSQRIAGRNRYRLVETRSIYFEIGRTEIRREDVTQLEHVAKALAADRNAVLEVQGFADPRGSDRSNADLSRARVEAAIRHLVRQPGVELRQLHSAAMGEADIRGKKGGEGYANARRVDMRLLTPWSSWEDQAQLEVPGDDAGAASPPTTDASAPGLRPSPSGQRLDDAPNRNAAGTALREILNTISKEDLGGRD